MKKYVFLDIHGVIDIDDIKEDMESTVFDEHCLYLLGVLLKNTGGELVITSSLRKNTLEETQAYFKSIGFPYSDKIVGQTIRGYKHIEKGFHMAIPRGVEVKQWIDNHIHRDNGKGPLVKKVIGVDYQYVILDDAMDFLMEQEQHLVLCFKTCGYGWNEHAKAIEILNKQS